MDSLHTKLLERIESFGKLEENWDSYGGGPVPQEFIERAKDFGLELLKLGIIPYVYPIAGGVGVWFEYYIGKEEVSHNIE